MEQDFGTKPHRMWRMPVQSGLQRRRLNYSQLHCQSKAHANLTFSFFSIFSHLQKPCLREIKNYYYYYYRREAIPEEGRQYKKSVSQSIISIIFIENFFTFSLIFLILDFSGISPVPQFWNLFKQGLFHTTCSSIIIA